MKIFSTLLLTLTILILSTSAFGAVARCKIVKTEGNKINLECKNVAGEFKKGEWVKVKSSTEND